MNWQNLTTESIDRLIEYKDFSRIVKYTDKVQSRTEAARLAKVNQELNRRKAQR